MKEEEAKTKMCPDLLNAMTSLQISMVKSGIEPGSEEIKKVEEMAYCQGSDCMKWVTEMPPLIRIDLDTSERIVESGSFGRCGMVNK